jgi:O-antigen/teichoic acid export membrane protein
LSDDGRAGSPTVRGMYELFLGNTSYVVLLAVTSKVVVRIIGTSGYGLYAMAGPMGSAFSRIRDWAQ